MFCCGGKKKKIDCLDSYVILNQPSKSVKLDFSSQIMDGQLKINNQIYQFILLVNKLVIVQQQKNMQDNKYVNLKQQQLTFTPIFDKDFREQDKQEIGIKFIAYQQFALKKDDDKNKDGKSNLKQIKQPDELNVYIDNKEILQKLKKHLQSQMYFTEFRWNYKTIEMLGEGSSGTVFNIVNRNNLKQYAAKVIPKQELQKEENAYEAIQQEISLMMKTKSQYIIRLHEVYEDDNNLYLVLDLFNGGTLQDVIDKNNKKKKFKIEEIQKIMKQLVQGVIDLHSIGIMHRDIKPENIILKSEGSFELVLCDLGLATEYKLDKYLFQNVGTPGYVAPEVYYEKHQYSPICDIYSCGIILYQLYYDKFPFQGSNMQQILEQNKTSDVKLNKLSTSSKSDYQVVDLLKKMLTKLPGDRIQGIDVLNHQFFNLKEEDRNSLTDTTTQASSDTKGSPIIINKDYPVEPVSPVKIKQNLRKQIEKDYNFKMPNTPLMGKKPMQMDRQKGPMSNVLGLGGNGDLRGKVDSINISAVSLDQKNSPDYLKNLNNLNSLNSKQGSPQLENASVLLKQTLMNNQSKLQDFQLQDSSSGTKLTPELNSNFQRMQINSSSDKSKQFNEDIDEDDDDNEKNQQARQKVNSHSPALQPNPLNKNKQSKFYSPQLQQSGSQGSDDGKKKKVSGFKNDQKSNDKEYQEKLDKFNRMQQQQQQQQNKQNDSSYESTEKANVDNRLRQYLQNLEK